MHQGFAMHWPMAFLLIVLTKTANSKSKSTEYHTLYSIVYQLALTVVASL